MHFERTKISGVILVGESIHIFSKLYIKFPDPTYECEYFSLALHF